MRVQIFFSLVNEIYTIKNMATFHVAQEGPINALALNKDNTQVAIGGRNGTNVLLIFHRLYLICPIFSFQSIHYRRR